jgi:hypothetical protein
MAEISDIRAQIKVRLQTISGLEVFDYVPGAFSPPVAIVGFPEEIDYHEAMGNGMTRITIPVRVLVANTLNEETTRALETYLDSSGANSVKAAIEGDRDLGSTVSDCVVMRMSGAGEIELGNVVYLGADWELLILQ